MHGGAKPQAGAMPSIVRQLELNHVLDLGCGPATMLADLAQHDPNFIGWGLERNPAMCAIARKNLRGKNVRIIEGDAMRIRKSLPREVASRVRRLPPRARARGNHTTLFVHVVVL